MPGLGRAGPWASEEKPKKTFRFLQVFLFVGSPAGIGGISQDLPGRTSSGPVEDLLNENPSHVALGKLTTTNPRATGAQNPPQTPPPHAPGPFGRLGAPVADFGLPLAPFAVPLGSLWPSFGVPLAIVGPKGRLWGQARPALGPVMKT